MLIEFKADAHQRFAKTDQPNAKLTNLAIKEAINDWLNAPEDRNGPLPKDVNAKAIAIYGNSRMMIEMNSSDAANWIRTHLDRVIGNILKGPVKILARTYTVVARFVPITFDPTPANLKELEDAMDLPNGSIQEASWIKHPSKRTGHQKVANLKIFCTTSEAANTLINGPSYITGSRISIQKDIRSPGVCNKCQTYGHIIKDCKATTDTCGTCGGAHRTSTCHERTERKCTPCGSTDHSTKYAGCPIYLQHERSMTDRNPESLSPYYLTNEEWTWGIRPNATETLPPPTEAYHPRRNTRTTTTVPQAGQPIRRFHQTLLFQPKAGTNPAQRAPGTSNRTDFNDENSPQGADNSTTIPQ